MPPLNMNDPDLLRWMSAQSTPFGSKYGLGRTGLAGLFLRGLGSKLLSNLLQAVIFTVLWKYVEEKLTKKADAKKKNQ